MEVIMIPKEEYNQLTRTVKDIHRLISSQTPSSHTSQKRKEGPIDFAVEILKEKAGIESKKTIYKWSHEGRIPCEKRGKLLWFFEEGDLGLVPWIEAGMPHFGQQRAKNRLAEIA